jgi:Calx-beta domain
MNRFLLAGNRRMRVVFAIGASLAVLAALMAGTSGASGCTATWTGSANDGLWTTADNWSPEVVPGSGADVCVGLAGSYTITLTGSQSIEQLTLGGAGATPTLDVDNSASLSIGDSTAASLTLASGTLDNQGAIQVNPDGDNKTGGTATVAGTASAQAGSATGTPILLNNVGLDASGTGSGTFQMRGEDGSLTGDVGGGYTVEPLGEGSSDIGNIGGSAIIAVPSGTTNSGTIDFDTPDANGETSELTIASGTLTNDGTIESSNTAVGVVDGNLDNASSGSLTASAPLTIGLPSGDTCAAAVTFTQDGTVTVNTSDSFDVGGACASTTTLGGGSISNSGTFEINPDGDNEASGTSNITASVTATAGSATGSPVLLNNLSLDADGTGSGSFTMQGDANSLTGNIGSDYTVSVEGEPSQELGDFGGSAIAAVPSSITNSGTVELTTSDANSEIAELTLGSGATLTNDGQLSTLNAAKAFIDGDLMNGSTGTMTADTGTVIGETASSCSTEVTFTQDGSLTIGSGSTMAVGGDCPSATTLDGGSITSTGTLEINEDGNNDTTTDCEPSCTASVTASLSAQAGSETGNPILLNNAALNASGTGSGKVELQGDANSLTGDIGSGYTVQLAAVEESDLGDVGGNTVASASQSVTNHGTLEFTTQDSDDETDELAFTAGSLTNDGTLETDTTAVAQIVGGVANGGTGTISLGTNLTLGGSGESLSNAGSITIDGGATLDTGGAFTQSAGDTSIDATGELDAPGEVQINGGTLGGTGTVLGDVTNGGTVGPGGATPGTLTVTGTYMQTSAGVLAIDVQSSTRDELSVSGAATLAGTLALSTTGFTPTLNTTYTVLTDSSQSGQFGTVTGISSGPYAVSYDATDVKLTVTTASNFPDISIGNGSVADPDSGTATLTFTVTLSKAAPTGATVDYATANGTASAPTDYDSKSGTVTFGDGQTSQTISITVNPDPTPGPDRTVLVNLTSPDGANIATGQGTGTIENDHVAVSSVTPNTGTIGKTAQITVGGAGFTGGTPTVTLVRSGAPTITATGVSVTSAAANQLTATVDLSSAVSGAYDVDVTLPTFNVTGTLAGAFDASSPVQIVASGETTPGGPGTSPSTGAVAGTVTDGSLPGTVAVGNAKITACPSSDPTSSSCVTATSAADGSYVIGGLKAGPWQLVVDPPGSLFEASGVVTIVADKTLHEFFALQEPAPLSGGISVVTPGGTDTSGVPRLNWSIPFGINWPIQILANGTPNSSQVVTDFTHIGGGYGTNGDPLDSEGMEAFEVYYGADGTPAALSPMLQAGFDCTGASGTACQLLGDPSETSQFESFSLGTNQVQIGLKGGQTLTFNTYGQTIVPINVAGNVFTDDSPANAAASPLANPFAQNDLLLQPAIGPSGGIYGLGEFGGLSGPVAAAAAARAAGDRGTVRTDQSGTGSRSTNLQVQTLPNPGLPTGTASRTPSSSVAKIPFPSCVSHGSRSPVGNVGMIGKTTGTGQRQPVTGGLTMMVNQSAHGPFSGSNSPVSWNDNAGSPARDVSGAHAASVADCGNDPTPLPPGGFGGYIDPSGQVLTTSKIPVAGAKVVLSSAATKHSKPVKVLNGSTVMSPANRSNPSVTDEFGDFGWDTEPGFYKITVTHSGCKAASGHGSSASTSLFSVPPARANLVLKLRCPHLRLRKARVKLYLAAGKAGAVAATVVTGSHGTPLGTVSVTVNGRKRGTGELLPADHAATFDLPGVGRGSRVKVTYQGNGVYGPISATRKVP